MDEAISILRNAGFGYAFQESIQRISDSAGTGDELSFLVIKEMLKDCPDRDSWKKNNYWCSMALNALSGCQSSEALKFIMSYIRKLPENIPFGVIDLLSGILPRFGKFILGPAKELANDPRSALRAVGIQTLCNMYLDGELRDDNNIQLLDDLTKNFSQDSYRTEHHVELVRMALHRASMDNDELVDEFDDLF